MSHSESNVSPRPSRSSVRLQCGGCGAEFISANVCPMCGGTNLYPLEGAVEGFNRSLSYNTNAPVAQVPETEDGQS